MRPTGTIPAAGDIGYWAPGGDLVLYYDDDAPYFDGIVRIGEFDGDLDGARAPERRLRRLDRTGRLMQLIPFDEVSRRLARATVDFDAAASQARKTSRHERSRREVRREGVAPSCRHSHDTKE